VSQSVSTKDILELAHHFVVIVQWVAAILKWSLPVISIRTEIASLISDSEATSGKRIWEVRFRQPSKVLSATAVTEHLTETERIIFDDSMKEGIMRVFSMRRRVY
jgi:hypothetical protein